MNLANLNLNNNESYHSQNTKLLLLIYTQTLNYRIKHNLDHPNYTKKYF